MSVGEEIEMLSVFLTIDLSLSTPLFLVESVPVVSVAVAIFNIGTTYANVD